MHSIQKPRTIRQTQRGFVSLVVALTLVIILALLTVGFAHLSRQNQQRALDKQLSVQANYAAETGINDATQAISQNLIPVGTPSNQCLHAPLLPNPSTINSNANASYTCVLVNLQPPRQGGTNVGPGTDRTLTFSTTSPPAELFIQWGSIDTSRTSFPATPGSLQFPPFAAWPTAPAVLQLQITPYASIDRNSLIANAFTAYLYPSKPPDNTLAYSPGQGSSGSDGPVLSGGCDPSSLGRVYPCRVTITGLDNIGGPYSGPYLVHIVDYYDTSNFQITAVDSSNNPVSFKDGQVVIDATGKAQDVVKRLQVLKPINKIGSGSISNTLALPDYAIEAQDICKRMETDPTNGTRFIATKGGVASAGNDPACQLYP